MGWWEKLEEHNFLKAKRAMVIGAELEAILMQFDLAMTESLLPKVMKVFGLHL